MACRPRRDSTMRRQILPSALPACQICGRLRSSSAVSSRFAPLAKAQRPQRTLFTRRRFQATRTDAPLCQPKFSSSVGTLSFSTEASQPSSPAARRTSNDPREIVKYVTTVREKLDNIPGNGIIADEDVVLTLSKLEATAGSVVDAASLPPNPTASALLDLDDDAARSPKRAAKGHSIPGPYKDAINKISDTAYRLISHPNVFISPDVLDKYVRVQARLGLPETLGHVFELYGKKPLPRISKNTVRYVKQNPNSHTNAIPPALANMALDTAIAAKNLDAAVAIIQNSFDTPAFRRSKFIRKGLIPAGVFAFTPVVIYDIASSLAVFQNTMDQGMATFVAFAAISAYVGFTAALGIIARMSSSEKVKRVSWSLGVPLRHRWIHEEQRTAYDKVACAWGFKEQYRFGEETGEEWEVLREYLGQKGMVLDAVELMEGMQ